MMTGDLLINGHTVIHESFSFLQMLTDKARDGFVRFPVFLFGDDVFIVQTLGMINEITVISDDSEFVGAIPWSRAKQMLGQETGSLAVDIRHVWDIEKLCAAAGCIRGGGLLVLIAGKEHRTGLRRFDNRLMQLAKHPAVAICRQNGDHEFPLGDVCLHQSRQLDPVTGKTVSQQRAVEAIERVLRGHRRRPALLVADRGRGKSSAMGIAAAEILRHGTQKIIVTSPRFANVDALFSHARQRGALQAQGKFSLVDESGGRLEFIAPDVLLRERPICDLLLVDEAAAIPLPMLGNIVRHYSRVVFSSTEHGYEGTGRSFSTRFRTLLDTEAKGWREIRLTEPVRWAQQDPLERWLFEAFLFDVEPALPANTQASVSYQTLSQTALAQDEAELRQLFSLLVTAHYQTSPNDLVQLLDGEHLVILGAYCDGVLIGALLASMEGGFEPSLAQAVARGERRLRGHLLAQSLATHTGLAEVLAEPMLRIVRLAVLPEFRRQGIARSLVKYFEETALKQGIAVTGTSFGITPTLWQFWSKLGYLPLRLGVQRDAASGTYSLQLAKAISTAPDWFEALRALFYLNLEHQLPEQFADMDSDLVALLLTGSPKAVSIDENAMNQVSLFADGKLGYDLVTGSLWQWFIHLLATVPIQDETDNVCTLMVAKLLQRQSWERVAKHFGFRGRKDTEMAIRDWIQHQLTNKDNR
ncbi:tRNA(Met) cytidine acetyltransferase TmcA [Grimontia hollisae]|nr:tRNA(Met) cytidine acetyltransferase TmcA [Grimontia hollisae]